MPLAYVIILTFDLISILVTIISHNFRHIFLLNLLFFVVIRSRSIAERLKMSTKFASF